MLKTVSREKGKSHLFRSVRVIPKSRVFGRVICVFTGNEQPNEQVDVQRVYHAEMAELGQLQIPRSYSVGGHSF